MSIERQREAAQQYAAARGWEIVAEHTDLGVSATYNRPDARPGWRALLDDPEPYEAVIVWKVDRLARRVMDFLTADEALQARGAGVVSVEETIDMTTPTGRAFATMLAVFAELEAATIRARVKAARSHLVRAGRVVGGKVPYGWRSVPNPDGPGRVLACDPDTIGTVRTMVDRTLAGESLYSTQRWLEAEGIPSPTGRPTWAYSTVERILRHPVLAGLTLFNPGNESKARGDDVLRDDTGLPVVDESIAIITPETRRALLALLDGRDSPQARPRTSKGATSPLLSRLATCGHCDAPMHRGTTTGRPTLSCPDCHQTISTPQLTDHLVDRLLSERGGVWLVEQVWEDDTPTGVSEISQAITDLTGQIGAATTEDEEELLLEKVRALKAELRDARRDPAPQLTVSDRTVADAWEAAETDLERRDVLAGELASLRIVRGKVGRYLDTARVLVEWVPAWEPGDEFPEGWEALGRALADLPESEAEGA